MSSKSQRNPFYCTNCWRHIRTYRMHFFMSQTQVVCGTCIHDQEQPIAACQTRESAYGYLKGTGQSCAK